MSTLRVNSLLNAAGTDTPAIDGLAKAWVNFDGTGTPSIRAAFNVSSITDNGTGDYTVNFTNAMPDANYSASAQTSLTNTWGYTAFDRGAQTASNYRIQCATTNAYSVTDTAIVSVAIFR